MLHKLEAEKKVCEKKIIKYRVPDCELVRWVA